MIATTTDDYIMTSSQARDGEMTTSATRSASCVVLAAVLALRSRCATHTPASGEPSSRAVHDDGGGSPSSSLPS